MGRLTPSHAFDMRARAMDKALAVGDIAVTLPCVKKKGVEAQKATYNSNEEAIEKSRDPSSGFYQKNYLDICTERSREIGQAAQAVPAIHNRNAFPD